MAGEADLIVSAIARETDDAPAPAIYLSPRSLSLAETAAAVKLKTIQSCIPLR
jgi:hypothetical protein